MTLSNFDWTDKDSVKWFILLPMGHEGPYSLDQLASRVEKKKISPDVEIWAEGLAQPVHLKDALATKNEEPEETVEEDILPDLPEIPKEEDEIPPLPVLEESESIEIPVAPPEKKNIKLRVWGFLFVCGVLMLYFAFGNVLKDLETFKIHRLSKMNLELHERIMQENAFDGWNKKIFFKEYISDDHTHIWLVNTGFQTCQVEADFRSLPGKMLTTEAGSVAFKTKGTLTGHVTELSHFEFSSGNKIIPGLYEMDVKATHCEWEGLVPTLMNKFQGPDSEYVARMKVVLFSKGPQEFNKILDRIIQKKMEEELKAKNEEELFWQDLQQKFETLQAVTLQVEQLLLDFLDGDPAKFKANLPQMVDQYTRKYGSFFTSFVVENENYFRGLKEGSSKKRNYELTVTLTTKRIGLETMKLIEDFQKQKQNPSKAQVSSYVERVKQVYAALKYEIAQKIIQVSEDRSH